MAWGLPGGFAAGVMCGGWLRCPGRGPLHAFLPWRLLLLQLSEGLLEVSSILWNRCWLHNSQLIFSQEGTGVMDAPEKVLNWLGTSYPWEHLWHLVCFTLLRWGSGRRLPWSRLVTVGVFFRYVFFFFHVENVNFSPKIDIFFCFYFFIRWKFSSVKLKKSLQITVEPFGAGFVVIFSLWLMLLLSTISSGFALW